LYTLLIGKVINGIFRCYLLKKMPGIIKIPWETNGMAKK
jgi:hypothetical protein